MDEKGGIAELQRQLERAKRLAWQVSDPATLDGLRSFADELGRRLIEPDIRARARELWEAGGRPTGRDQEFWLQAERELTGSDADRH